MPDPKALTPEQINLLRGLPGQLSELKESPDSDKIKAPRCKVIGENQSNG